MRPPDGQDQLGTFQAKTTVPSTATARTSTSTILVMPSRSAGAPEVATHRAVRGCTGTRAAPPRAPVRIDSAQSLAVAPGSAAVAGYPQW